MASNVEMLQQTKLSKPINQLPNFFFLDKTPILNSMQYILYTQFCLHGYSFHKT